MLALPYYEEKWIKPEGFSMYEISNMGNGKSNKKRKVFLKPLVNKDGYLYFILIGDDGKRHTCYIHRLVAKAFIENPDPINFKEINHKDEVKSNNYFTNLEWCDRTYQIRYGHCIEKGAKKRQKPVYQYTLDGKLVGVYSSRMEAEKMTGISNQYISHCCNGRYPSAKGFIFQTHPK